MSEVVPDPMDAEQTWPTEQELGEADQSKGAWPVSGCVATLLWRRSLPRCICCVVWLVSK